MPSPAKKTPPQQQLVLEINLISAQGLKPPSSLRRRLQTYAVTWIDPSMKLRTRVDKIGGQNPTWNDKFLFRVTPEYVASETSGISVAIYAVGTFRDHLVGTVRFLISNIVSPGTPRFTFTAVQIQRPSGRFDGVMNIGAMVIDGSSGFPALEKISAIGYRDLMGEKIQSRPRRKMKSKSKAEENEEVSSESCENSCTESVDLDEAESSTTTSSSSSPRSTAAATTALKEWNGVRELAGAGKKGLAGSGFLCCLVGPGSIRCLGPTSNRNELER